jgi:hypothetical protein
VDLRKTTPAIADEADFTRGWLRRDLFRLPWRYNWVEQAMKVFLSYGSAADQVTALRLQALGAVNGLTVYVPPAYTRQQFTAAPFDEDSARKMDEADVILGVVGMAISMACQLELQASLASQKPTIVMAGPLVARQLQPSFGSNLIVVDPANPDVAEQAIVLHLKNLDAEKRAKSALIALGTLALGLLVLAAVVPQD